jgi:hypothetical protein
MPEAPGQLARRLDQAAERQLEAAEAQSRCRRVGRLVGTEEVAVRTDLESEVPGRADVTGMPRPSGCSERPEQLRGVLGPDLLDRGQPVLRRQDDVDLGEAALVLRRSVQHDRAAAPDREQHGAVCQCTGRAIATVLSGPTSNSSCSRFAVLATQLARVVPESSTRSPVASSYWVTSGAAGVPAQDAGQQVGR